MEIFGKIKKAWVSASGTDRSGREWKRSSILIEEVIGTAPQSVLVECFGSPEERRINVGMVGTMHFYMEAREWNGRIFNSVGMRKWEEYKPSGEDGEPTGEAGKPSGNAEGTEAGTEATVAADGKVDDLPF